MNEQMPNCTRCETEMAWGEAYVRFDDGVFGGWKVKSRAFYECPSCNHKMARPDGKGLLNENSPVKGSA